MKIETLDDWNSVLAGCGCCAMPVCDGPIQECETKSGTQEAVGWNWYSFQARYGLIEMGGWSTDDIPCSDRVRLYRSWVHNTSYTSTDEADDGGGVVTTHTVSVDSGAVYNALGYPSPNTGVGTGFASAVDTYVSDGQFSGTETSVYTGTPDITVVTSWDLTFGDPITVEFLIVEAMANYEAAEWVTSEGCASSIIVTFSECNEEVTDAPESIEFVFARVRFSVPADYSTESAPRSTYELQWDNVSASTEWWAWYDGGMAGVEPTPGPTLVSCESWTWGGSMESPWSEWYDLPVPATDGETRIVNLMSLCYRSTRMGIKPTAHGDQVALPL